MLSRLAHRGPDGPNRLIAGNLGLGCAHFWTTPEDVGVRQPLADASGRYAILFDGRLDNRSQTLAALGVIGPESRAWPDAEIVLRAYLRWGEACFSKLIGPMAAAIVDHAEQRVTLTRDALGSRSLFYYIDHRVLVVASEPYAVLAHPAVSPTLDESSIIRWCAVMAPRMGATFFADVREALPAHGMVVEADQARAWRFWELDPEAKLDCRSDADYTERFRELLAASVRACLRSTTPVAISLSGGSDSTSVAALAALALSARLAPERLLTFSWFFDELPECDERPVIKAVNRHFNTVATYIPGDDAWPLRDWETWPRNPNHPESNSYRLLKMRLYQAVAQAGSRTLLTGVYGNELLGSSDYWLAESIRDGRIGPAVVGLLKSYRRGATGKWIARISSFRALSWALDVLPGGRRLRPRRQPAPPSWLTPEARDSLAAELPDEWPPSAARSRRPGHHTLMLGAYSTTGIVWETRPSAQAGIDLRHPYHDQRLVEFAMALPAYWVYDGQQDKRIVRQAMAAILPDNAQPQPNSGLLGPLYRRGLLDRESATLDRLLNNHAGLWRQYVRPEAMLRAREWLKTSMDGAWLLLPWLCASLEIWRLKSPDLLDVG